AGGDLVHHPDQRLVGLAVSPAFFEEARQAHEALIGMMDQVAAGLQVTPRPERVAALQELLEAPAAEALRV
ncbi:hypothetical protein ACV344_32985, partial [Pseudomonas aeruginosa]